MDTRWLRSFVEVVYHQSISRAAEHLGYTQQAVSQHVARLEQTLGATLLHRGPRGVTITPKGERVYFRAQSILDEVDLTAQEVQSADDFATDVPSRGRVLPLPPEARGLKSVSQVDISDSATRRQPPTRSAASHPRNSTQSERDTNADGKSVPPAANGPEHMAWNRRTRGGQ